MSLPFFASEAVEEDSSGSKDSNCHQELEPGPCASS